MNEEVLRKLYESAQKYFSMPSFEQFAKDMQDANALDTFRQSMSKHYSMPDLETLKKDIGFTDTIIQKKSQDEPVSVGEEATMVSPTEPIQEEPITSDSLAPKPEIDTQQAPPTEQEVLDAQAELQLREEDPFYGTILSSQRPDDIFEDRIKNYVDAPMMEKSEENAVPELNMRFNDYGFSFKQAGMGDAMVVEALNGESERINLDRMKGIPTMYGYVDFGLNKREAEKLKKFLRENKTQSEEINNVLIGADKLAEKERQIKDDEDLQNTIKIFNRQTEIYRKNYVDLASRINNYRTQYDAFKNMSQEEKNKFPDLGKTLEAEKLSLEKEALELSNKEQDFKSLGGQLDRAAGEYTMMKEKQGKFGVGVFGKSLGTGYEKIAKSFFGGLSDFMLQSSTSNLPIEFPKAMEMMTGENKESFADLMVDYAVKELKENPEKFDAEGMADSRLSFFDVGTERVEQGKKFKEIILSGDISDEDAKFLKTYLKSFNHDATKALLNEIKVKGTGKKGTMRSIKEGYTEEDIPDKGLGVVSSNFIKDGMKKYVKYYQTEEEKFRPSIERYIETGSMRKPVSPFSETTQMIAEEAGMIDAITGTLSNFGNMEDVTEQYIQLQKEDTVKGAVIGAFESIPAILTGGGTLGNTTRIAYLMAQTSDMLDEEMRADPDFDGVSESEKYMLKAPVSIAVATLENLGLRNIVRQKGLFNGILGRAFSKSTSKTTAKEFGDFIRQDVDNLVARYGLTLLGAGAAEFETGFAQELSTMTLKELYNQAKSKEMFKQPDTWLGWLGQSLYAGGQELIGGFVLGQIPAVTNAAYSGKLATIDNDIFDLFEKISKDDTYKNLYKTQIKNKINSGEMTEEEGAEALNKLNQVQGVMEQLLEDTPTEIKKKALSLLLEKQILEGQVDGKNEQLSKRKRDRIKEIDSQITRMEALAIEEGQLTREAEAAIPELGDTKVKPIAETEEGQVAPTEEEKSDIAEFFGEETTEARPMQNIFFSRKGKRQEAETPNTKAMRGKVVRFASNAANAVQNILPDTKIILHETSESFNENNPVGRGFFNFDTNEIHINLEKATATTVGHEVFHAVLYNKLGEEATGKSVLDMVRSVEKVLPKDNIMKLRMQQFVEANQEKGDLVAQEEGLSELFGMLSSEYDGLKKPTQNKIVNFIKEIAAKFNIDLGQAFGQKDADVIDLLNTLSRKIKTGEVVTKEDVIMLDSTPYSSASVPLQINPENTTPRRVRGRQSKIIYQDVDFAENLEEITLTEFSNMVNGQLYAVTSDATKVGYDRFGNRVDGGFGYLAIGKNIRDKVGFASTSEADALSVYKKASNEYAVGSKVGILIMVQDPSATIGNLYGGKYLYRALAQFQKESPNEYKELVDSLIAYTENNGSVRKAMKARFEDKVDRKGNIKTKAQYKREDMISLFDDPASITEEQWAERWIEVTNFPVRRELLKGLIPSTKSVITNKNTPIIKQKFKDSNITIEEFLKEFGDVKLLGKENLLGRDKSKLKDTGGYIVGGFIMTIEENPKQIMSEIQSKGYTHPQFKGRYPSEGSYIFDGLYEIQENFLPFAAPQTKIDETKITKEAVADMVQEMFPRDLDYDSEFRDIPLKKRTYTHLTTANKTIFKENNQDILKEVEPKLKADVARMLGMKLQELPPQDYEFTARGRQQKEIADLIIEGREGNFRDSVIEDFLVNVLKYAPKMVRDMMSINADLFNVLPRSFRNVKGGIKVGAKLYSRVKDYEQSLVKKNKRKKVKLTEAQIADKTIEFLEQQPEYQAEAETYTVGSKKKGTQVVKKRKYLSTQQAAMLAEFQQTMGTRPTEFIARKIREARAILKERKRGSKELQKAKTFVRNFIRRSLPKDLYQKDEVIKLINELNRASYKNIEVDGVKTTEIEDVIRRIERFILEKNLAKLDNNIKRLIGTNYTTTQSGRVKGKIVSAYVKDRIDTIKNLIIVDKKLNQQERNNRVRTQFTEDSDYKKSSQGKPLSKRTFIDLTSENQAIFNETVDKSLIERITKTNTAIQERLNKLQQIVDPTDAELDLMTDLEIALQYNESLLSKDDVFKLEQLDFINNNLKDLIDLGRTELREELAEQSAYYKALADTAIEVITGVKQTISTQEGKAKVDLANQKILNQKKNRLKNVLRKTLNTISTRVKKFFNEAEALDGLMDLISKLPAEMFGGKLQEIVTNRVDTASRQYKEGMMMQETIVREELERIYGKKWRDAVRENNQINRKGEPTYVLDKEQVAKAEADFEAGRITEKEYRTIIAQNYTYLNQNQMAYYYNLYKDPMLRGSFRNTFGENYVEVMENIEKQLDPKLKEFADWQVDVMYPALYDRYNEVYRKIYRTNMPWNEFYAGMVYRDGVETDTLNLLDNQSVYQTAVGAASTKARQGSQKPIKAMNNMNVMSTYLRDMEYFRAYAEVVRDLNKLFNNKQIKDSIAAIHGDYVNRLIKNVLENIATKGVSTTRADKFINTMNNLYVLSKIGLNPTVMIKQLTSMITYANDIGYRNWLKYSLKNIPEIRKTFKEISENSVYMQDRNKTSITRIIESYTEDGMVEFVPNKYWDNYVNFIMYSTKFGDKAAIYLGGMPNYLYYKDQAKKRGLSEEEAKKEAIIKFERDTKRTQQSSDIQDKDYYQTAGALQRGLNMFLTTPKQYLRKEIQATRNLYRKIKAWDKNAGAGTLGQNIRTLLTYHVFAPLVFQWVALGMPLLLRPTRDEDKDDLLRAMIIGNLNALFIVGEAVNAIGDIIQDKSWAGQAGKSIAPLMLIKELSNLWIRYENTNDPVKKQKYLNKFIAELIDVRGIPATQIQKFLGNMEKLGEDGDIGEDILRLLNYSNYIIEGHAGKKSGKSSGKSEAQKQEEQYKKELERREREFKKMQNSERFRKTKK